MAYEKGVTCSPTSMAQLTPAPENRVSYTVPPRWDIGPSLPSTSAGERQGQFSSVVASEGRGQFYTALSSQSLVVTGATDLNRVCGCIRALNPDMGPISSPGPAITMALGGNQATHLQLYNSVDLRLL